MMYRGDNISFRKGNKVGSGGNGDVYSIICHEKKEELVAKFLRKSHKKKTLQRFKQEIKAIGDLYADSKGILPILDSFVTENMNKKDDSWYVMPYAQTLENVLFNQGIECPIKIEWLIDIAKVIEYVHARGYSHRDIKMGNLLFYNGSVVLSDFGLAAHESFEKLTLTNEKVGPWNTIAPEMKRSAGEVTDPQPSDVYSFGKLIWIVLTEDNGCFDGQYLREKNFSLKSKELKVATIEIIHEILTLTTNDDMSQRPSITEVIQMLHKWKEVVSDKKKLLDEQRMVNNRDIYKKFTPDIRSYSNLDEINEIMKRNCGLYSLLGKQFNNMKLKSCVKNSEEKCIEISDNYITYLIKPKLLTIISKEGVEKYVLKIDNCESTLSNKQSPKKSKLFYGSIESEETHMIRTREDDYIQFIPLLM